MIMAFFDSANSSTLDQRLAFWVRRHASLPDCNVPEREPIFIHSVSYDETPAVPVHKDWALSAWLRLQALRCQHRCINWDLIDDRVSQINSVEWLKSVLTHR